MHVHVGRLYIWQIALGSSEQTAQVLHFGHLVLFCRRARFAVRFLPQVGTPGAPRTCEAIQKRESCACGQAIVQQAAPQLGKETDIQCCARPAPAVTCRGRRRARRQPGGAARAAAPAPPRAARPAARPGRARGPPSPGRRPAAAPGSHPRRPPWTLARRARAADCSAGSAPLPLATLCKHTFVHAPRTEMQGGVARRARVIQPSGDFGSGKRTAHTSPQADSLHTLRGIRSCWGAAHETSCAQRQRGVICGGQQAPGLSRRTTVATAPAGAAAPATAGVTSEPPPRSTVLSTPRCVPGSASNTPSGEPARGGAPQARRALRRTLSLAPPITHPSCPASCSLARWCAAPPRAGLG